MRHTARITVVLDARRDMYEAGYGLEHDEPFEAAYRDAARKLQSAVNRRLGGHRLDLCVVSGGYTGPEMQEDDQPEGINVWQALHDMLHHGGGEWVSGDPDRRTVDELRHWVFGTVRQMTGR